MYMPIENPLRNDLQPILCALGRELASMAAAGCKLQDVLGLSTSLAGPNRSQAMQDMQAFDELTQRLSALAEFIAVLAPTVTAGSSCDLRLALAGISLTDVARRLEGKDALGPVQHDAGALELFGDDA